ncbi:hypothetical protein [Uliginosibacterium paludis]
MSRNNVSTIVRAVQGKAAGQEMKACVSYWTVGCVKPRKDNKRPRLTDSRYVSATGEVRDYSMHCMIDDRATALDFANTVRPDILRQQDPACQLVVEQVSILISWQEKARLERRIVQQSAAVKKFLAGRFTGF